MTNEEVPDYLRLCRKAALKAANGKWIDIEDVVQELMTWIIAKAIPSPSYRGLFSLLVREAEQYHQRMVRQRNPVGWSQMSWSAEEIRQHLEMTYPNLDPQIARALASKRMPESYRESLDSFYGLKVKPARGSSAERTLYRAVDRLLEIINYPTGDGVVMGAEFEIGDMTDEEDREYSTRIADAEMRRRRVNSAPTPTELRRWAAQTS